MARIIRKYLVVLLTNCLPYHDAYGIRFTPNGKEVLTEFVIQEPGFTIKWSNRIFLKKGTHTTRQLVEEGSIWLTTIITRYVEVDCTDIISILEGKQETRHEPTNNPYAAVLGNKNKNSFENQLFSIKNDE